MQAQRDHGTGGVSLISNRKTGIIVVILQVTPTTD